MKSGTFSVSFGLHLGCALSLILPVIFIDTVPAKSDYGSLKIASLPFWGGCGSACFINLWLPACIGMVCWGHGTNRVLFKNEDKMEFQINRQIGAALAVMQVLWLSWWRGSWVWRQSSRFTSPFTFQPSPVIMRCWLWLKECDYEN